MAYQIWRVAQVGPPTRLRNHIAGKTRNVSIGSRTRANGLFSTERLIDGIDATDSVIREGDKRRRELKRRGPKPSHYKEMLFAGPPQFKSDECWSAEDIRSWENRCLDWVQRVFVTAHIDLAEAHHDETAPHLHVLIVPKSEDGTISWRRLQKESARRLDPKVGNNSQSQMRTLQNSCWWYCGKPFDMERGEISEKPRKHRATDHVKAAENIAEEITKEAVAEKEKVAEREAAVAEQERVIVEERKAIETVRIEQESVRLAQEKKERELAAITAAQEEGEKRLGKLWTELRDARDAWRLSLERWRDSFKTLFALLGTRTALSSSSQQISSNTIASSDSTNSKPRERRSPSERVKSPDPRPDPVGRDTSELPKTIEIDASRDDFELSDASSSPETEKSSVKTQVIEPDSAPESENEGKRRKRTRKTGKQRSKASRPVNPFLYARGKDHPEHEKYLKWRREHRQTQTRKRPPQNTPEIGRG